MTLNVWLLEEAMHVFLSVCTTFTPSSRFEGSTLSTSCPALACSCFVFFHHSHPQVLSQHGFDLYFHND